MILLSATSGGVSIISFTSIALAPVGMAYASVTLIFSLTTGIVKKLLNITRNKKKKHDKILCRQIKYSEKKSHCVIRRSLNSSISYR